VTNREFRQFVDSGGYRRPELWDPAIVLDGEPVAWAEAMSRFTDRTGRPGPATWEAGDYPSGQADHPVAGVSWYEASAYARFAGKALPTVYHWSSAAATPLAFALVPNSNFAGKGTAPAGRYPALGLYGLKDMAGNVREWCANATGGSRYVLGGGWSDPEYSFTDGYAQAPGDRSPINGIRLVQYTPGDTSLAAAARPVERLFRDFRRERPASDAVFGVYRRQFEYDRQPLDAVAEAVDSSSDVWIREKIVINAAYGGERLPLYLFLPRGRTPPYQTVVYFPGSNALHTRVAEGALESRNFDFVLKSGRAVLYPVYKSTYERGDSTASDYSDETNRYREHVVMWGKDLRRAIDYLESRPDLARDKVAYFGSSWGGALGGIWPAIEPRLKASVLLVAGLVFTPAQPEVDVINYLPRVRIPVLMLNGQYDFFFPVETSQVPMFRLLGTPAEHKRQVISQGGHFVPRTQLISETLSWLDRYLGAVE
jgi:dienelactone hydrolase